MVRAASATRGGDRNAGTLQPGLVGGGAEAARGVGEAEGGQLRDRLGDGLLGDGPVVHGHQHRMRGVTVIPSRRPPHPPPWGAPVMPDARPRPYDREIARLAVPALGALAAEPLYLLADTAIVGHLGTRPLAGLAVAGSVLTAAFSVFNFLAYSHHRAASPASSAPATARRGRERGRRAAGSRSGSGSCSRCSGSRSRR